MSADRSTATLDAAEAHRRYASSNPDAPSREQRLAIIAARVTVALWASAFVGIRAAGRMLSAGPLSLGRLLVGSLALGLLVLIRCQSLPSRRDLIGVVVCGLLWFGTDNVLLNQAERVVDAGTAAMLVNIGPIFVAVLSGLLLKEGFPRRLLIGCAMAFAGTVTIGLATSTRGLQAVGAVLCIAAATAYAGGVTAEKPLLARTAALPATGAHAGATGALFAAVSLASGCPSMQRLPGSNE